MTIFKALTRTEKFLLAGLALVFAVSLGFRLALAWNRNMEEVPVSGGEYREGVVGQPVYVNPIISNGNDVDRDLAALIYANLSDLAADVEMDASGKVYTVKLKEGLLWSDDENITSDDVVFTAKVIQDPDAHSPLFQSWQGVIVERISELQLRFALREPYVFFENNLARLPVIPQHIFGGIPPANIRLSGYNLEPVGSGPYKFSNYEKRKDGFIEEYRLAVNKNYSGQAPFIEDFSFRFYAGEEELIGAFNKREIDGFGGLNPLSLDRISSDNKVRSLLTPRYYAVFFNQSINSALKEAEVREALLKSVDRSRIISSVFDGLALEVKGPMLPGFEGYNSEVYAGVNYSPEEARKIAESLGKDGEAKPEFNLVVPQIDFLIKTAEIIKSEWEEIGFVVNLQVLNPNDVVREIIRSRNYEMLLFGVAVANQSDLFPFWHSSERFYPGLNLSLYNNPKVDGLLEGVRQDSDRDSRLADLTLIQDFIVRDAPALFLYSPKYLYVATPSLGGFGADNITTAADRFKNVEEWFLRTARVF